MEAEIKSVYFPPLAGAVDCGKCELTDCLSRGRYQRDRRDFSVGSGRCPRLPDKRGYTGRAEWDLYTATFPLIHAKRDDGRLSLTMTAPGMKRPRRVYFTRGYWWIRDKDPDGAPARRAVTIDGYIEAPAQVQVYMDGVRTDHCVFRCTVEDYFI